MTPLISADNISKSFPCGKAVLEKVSLYLAPGELVGLMGKSGEGKSTIAKLLCGRLRPDSGVITFCGQPLGENTTGIQLVPQQALAALDPRQRLLDAVAEPILSNRLAADRAQAYRRAAELLESVWLPAELYRRRPAQLSGGQAQRAVIARALAVCPQVILADEATAMLDTIAQAQVAELLRRAAAGGSAVLVVSHDMALVGALCGRRYYLESTRLMIND